MKFVKALTGALSVKPSRKVSFERDLIRREAKIGGQLFGEVPAGHTREFFCLDERTWVWYEKWAEGGEFKEITTRYEIQDHGILKTQGTDIYHYATPAEQAHLINAIKLYYKYVAEHVYGYNMSGQQQVAHAY